MPTDFYNDFLNSALQENTISETPDAKNMAEVSFRTDVNCKVFCDGEFLLIVEANKIAKAKVAPGVHLLQFFSLEFDELPPVERMTSDYEVGKQYFENMAELKPLVDAASDKKALAEAKARAAKAKALAEEEARIREEEEKRREEEEKQAKARKEAAEKKAAAERKKAAEKAKKGSDVIDLAINGYIYTGHIRYKVPHEKGKATWPNGDVYDGAWEDGERTGKGRMLYANGDVYNGDWKDGEPNGQGKMRWANGDKYSGGWKNGKLYGRGSFEEKGGRIWDGQWELRSRIGNLEVHGNRYLFQLLFTAKSGLTGLYSGPLAEGKPDGLGKVVFDDKSIYEGSFQNGLRHGKGRHSGTYWFFEGDFKEDLRTGYGVYTWPDGRKYEGNWENDLRSGKGKLTLRNGSIYEGNWKDDAPSGQGSFFYPSGTCCEGQWDGHRPSFQEVLFAFARVNYTSGERYEGEWLEDGPSGDGRMTFANGDVYQGKWAQGKPNGQGTMTLADGSICEGQWDKGMQNGKGKITYASGDLYDGEWNNGKPNGKGRMTYASGDVYEGQWQNGEVTGHGKMTWANGDIYEGGWKKGLPSGEGRLVEKGGTIYAGEWVPGNEAYGLEVHGYYFFFKQDYYGFQDGPGTYIGPLKAGKPEGRGSVQFKNGSRYEGDFRNGKRQGRGVLHYYYGAIYEGDFKEDIRNGRGKITNSDGDVYEGSFHTDSRIGIGKISYSNGDTFEGSFYHANIENAPCTFTWKNGEKLVCEGCNGIDSISGRPRANGDAIHFYADGKKKKEYWKNGEKIKEYSFFDKLFKRKVDDQPQKESMWKRIWDRIGDDVLGLIAVFLIASGALLAVSLLVFYYGWVVETGHAPIWNTLAWVGLIGGVVFGAIAYFVDD